MFEFQPLQPVGENNQYNMKVETQKFKMDIHVKTPKMKPDTPVAAPAVTDDGIINLITLPDGSKQLVFKLDSINTDSGETPGIGEIYEELVKTLQTKTNFNRLQKKADYLTAVVSLLETAYYGGKYENENIKMLFDELANELEIVTDEIEDEYQVEQLETFAYRPDQLEDMLNIENNPPSSDVSEVELKLSYPGIPKVKTIHADGVTVKIHSRAVKEESESYANKQDFEETVHHQMKQSVRGEKEGHAEMSVDVDVKNTGLPNEGKVGAIEQSQSSVQVEKYTDINMVKNNKDSVETKGLNNKNIDATGNIGDSVVDSQSNVFDTQTENTHSDTIQTPKSTIKFINPDYYTRVETIDEEQIIDHSEVKKEENSNQESQEYQTSKNAERSSHRGHGDL